VGLRFVGGGQIIRTHWGKGGEEGYNRAKGGNLKAQEKKDHYREGYHVWGKVFSAQM